MKYILIIIISIFCLSSIGSANNCNPDSDGFYKYYCNLKLIIPSDSFSVNEFLTYIAETDTSISSQDIEVSYKSFPSAESDFLKRSISVYSSRDDLVDKLGGYTSLFNVVEKVCLPDSMLLYDPNDLGSSFSDYSHLDLINAQEAWDIT